MWNNTYNHIYNPPKGSFLNFVHFVDVAMVQVDRYGGLLIIYVAQRFEVLPC